MTNKRGCMTRCSKAKLPVTLRGYALVWGEEIAACDGEKCSPARFDEDTVFTGYVTGKPVHDIAGKKPVQIGTIIRKSHDETGLLVTLRYDGHLQENDMDSAVLAGRAYLGVNATVTAISPSGFVDKVKIDAVTVTLSPYHPDKGASVVLSNRPGLFESHPELLDPNFIKSLKRNGLL